MHTNRRRIQAQTNLTFDVDYRLRTTEFLPYFTSFTHWHVVSCKTKIEFPELQKFGLQKYLYIKSLNDRTSNKSQNAF